jgi:1,4-alpha-glucan branching enzyme
VGNESGHPAKVEFPSRKNNCSFAYARRQWDLLNDSDNLYNWLLSLDQAMMKMDEKERILERRPARIHISDIACQQFSIFRQFRGS